MRALLLLTERWKSDRGRETALQWAAAGRLSPVVQSVPLARAAEAHHALETRATIGKVVLRPETDGHP